MRVWRLLFVGFTLAALQMSVCDLVRFRAASPDLLFLLAAYVSFHARLEESLFLTWTLGLVKDCASGADFGAFGFLFAVAGVLISTLKDYLFRDSLWVQVSLVFLGSLAYNSLYGLNLARESDALGAPWAVGRAFHCAAYSALCAPFAFAFLDGLRGYFRLHH